MSVSILMDIARADNPRARAQGAAGVKTLTQHSGQHETPKSHKSTPYRQSAQIALSPPRLLPQNWHNRGRSSNPRYWISSEAPRTGEQTVVSSLNLHLLPLSSAQLRGGSSVPLVILFPPSEPRNRTPKHAPYDERNRAQEHQSVSSVETLTRGVHARLRHTPKLRF